MGILLTKEDRERHKVKIVLAALAWPITALASLVVAISAAGQWCSATVKLIWSGDCDEI